jgi:hypothetical protein
MGDELCLRCGTSPADNARNALTTSVAKFSPATTTKSKSLISSGDNMSVPFKGRPENYPSHDADARDMIIEIRPGSCSIASASVSVPAPISC